MPQIDGHFTSKGKKIYNLYTKRTLICFKVVRIEKDECTFWKFNTTSLLRNIYIKNFMS